MHGEGLFGQAPRSWERKEAYIDGRQFDVWECEGLTTLQDPRLEALPSEWRRRYEGGHGEHTDYLIDENSRFRFPIFENKETGYRTYRDPRSALEHLQALNVNIQDFKLI
jgi:hypothetical protein